MTTPAPSTNEHVVERAVQELNRGYVKSALYADPFREGNERPSLLWRGDSIVLGAHANRWARRAYLREDTGSEFRRIGFANLRPLDSITRQTPKGLGESPFTADAFLSPPSHMRGREYALYSLSDFAAFYGEKGYGRTTCFAMPYQRGGGVCAHACIYMAATTLSRLGVAVPATHEVSFVNAQERNEIGKNGSFAIRGLRAREMVSVFQSELIRGSALLEFGKIRHGKKEDEDKRRLTFLLHQYVRQPLPVILIVDCGKLYPEMKKDLKYRHKKDEFPHAVIIVGVHFRKKNNKVTPHPEAIVYHDPLMGPYLETPASNLLNAATFKTHPSLVTFTVATPASVKFRLGDAWTYFLYYKMGYTNLNVKPFVGWLKSPDHVCQQQTLLRREDLVATYFSDLPASHGLPELIRGSIADLPSWIWGFEIYSDLSAFSRQEASAVWLFDATTSDPRTPPHGLFAMVQDETFHCWLPGLRIPYVVVRGRRRVERNRILI